MSETAKSAVAGLRVLVAEDNVLVGEFIRQILIDLGYAVVGPLHDLSETLREIQTNTLDGALLDVQLGQTSIYPAAHELALRGIPFVLASGTDLFGLPPLLANAPFLRKPFDAGQLEHILNHTIRPRSQVAP